ncbi:CDP-glycerol glycerophosphotransferase family protein [Vibrio campbellii]|uniref:CDP-glycerol glycerophosphotransferase family protein n=1 Tax=Vibrio campbellii TaxID=680 RepID=UPI001D17CB48|nr:CDP-glycerol glycerophosphotransferase family protein [Vibrio campbellii]MCC4226125.1 CDP-glycerol glycerophosphotransferase family protein [Vibrio campbellii]
MVIKLLGFLNFLIPKRGSSICFHSTPFFTGNSLAVYNKIANKDTIWLVDSESELEVARKLDVKAYYKKSIIGLYFYFRSKYIYSSHGLLLSLKSSRQTHIELWHGSPLKKMGYMESGTKSDFNHFSNIDILCASSILMKSLLSSCMRVHPKKIFITGQPRNEFLLDKTFDIKEKVSHYLSFPEGCERFFVYMPTFRAGAFNKSDGRIFNNSNPFNFSDFNMNVLNERLKALNLGLVIKLHPYEESLLDSQFFESDYIKLVKQDELYEHKIDFYEVLSYSDKLYTDYSSVYFDYLLLDKPIAFILTDLIDYKMNRGFLLEPLDFWLPGEKLYSFHEFLDSLAVLDVSAEQKIIKQMTNSSELSDVIATIVKSDE